MRPVASPLRIVPSGPLRGEVEAPSSKSATNRALLLAGLARGSSLLRRTLEADDTSFMVRALRDLGIAIEGTVGGDLRVHGCDGAIPAASAALFVGNAGTAMRFLAAAVSLGFGAYRLDGEPRMRQRPLGDLGSALASLGARVAYPGRDGYPPIEVSGGPLAGGSVVVRADRSSQFSSALLMVAPCTERGIELRVSGLAVSRPYVEMTVELMSAFGGPAVEVGADRYRVPGGVGYRAAEIEVEGDASAAAALFAAAAITGGSVRVARLRRGSRQPDLRFPDLLEEMGCRVLREPDAVRLQGAPLRGIRASLAECPDLAPSLAAVALFASGPTRIEGAAHLRFKESDRIGDLAEGLRRLGARVEERADGLTIVPGPLRGVRLDPKRDHRLAMAYAAVGLALEGVELEDPGCVAKSFPGFFDALDSLRS